MFPALRRSCGFAAGLVLACVSGLDASVGASAPAEREVWVTMEDSVFTSVTGVFESGPGGEVFPFLPRLLEAHGVVLTALPESALEGLAERIHRDFRRCGGFVKHESLAEARAALARLERLPEAPHVLPFAIDRPTVVTPLVAAVDEATILATITALSTNFVNRYHAHATGTNAANAIKSQWEGYAAGHPGVTVELYSHGGITPQPSVVATIPGTTLADEIVVVGAHEDSIRSGCSGNPTCTAPGADDDASGVASISEALRVLLASGVAPQRTIQFMAYAAEEVGLDGSDDIAADYAAAGKQVVAVLQQDMTAYEGSAIDVTIIQDSAYTNAELNQFLGALVDTYLPGLQRGTSNCGYGCSDHASWNVRGYPAAIAFEAPYPGSYNTALHTPQDTVATFGGSAAHAAKFAKIAVAFAVEAALDWTPDIFNDGFESSDLANWSNAFP